MGEINVLPISNFILLLIIYDPHATQIFGGGGGGGGGGVITGFYGIYIH